MEIAKLVLEYIKVLIWPFSLLILAIRLRAHIGHAFLRLTRLETPAATMEFAAAAAAVREEADHLSVSNEETGSDSVPDSDPAAITSPSPQTERRGGPREPFYTPEKLRLQFDTYVRFTTNHPTNAVRAAWARLEDVIQEAAQARGVRLSESLYLPSVDDDYPYNPLRATEAILKLRDFGITDQDIHIFSALTDLAAQARHLNEPTSSAAYDFVRSCRQLAVRIASLISVPQSA